MDKDVQAAPGEARHENRSPDGDGPVSSCRPTDSADVPRTPEAGFESRPILSNNDPYATKANDSKDICPLQDGLHGDGLRSDTREGPDMQREMRERRTTADAGGLEGATRHKETDGVSTARQGAGGCSQGAKEREIAPATMRYLRERRSGSSRGLREATGRKVAVPEASQGAGQGTWSNGELTSEPADSHTTILPKRAAGP